MSFVNIELKARTANPALVRHWLINNGAAFKGTDEQCDTYFNTPNGRLKLREGNIENTLIQYQRADAAGPKQSDFQVMDVTDSVTLKNILTSSLGIKTIVKKRREIYFVDNVKFHIDYLSGLGDFVEIEASNKNHPHISLEKLRDQCEYYKTAFSIQEQDLVQVSYSDMLFAGI